MRRYVRFVVVVSVAVVNLLSHIPHFKIHEILEDKHRKFVYYNVVFPSVVNHTVFKQDLDGDQEVHLNFAGIKYTKSSEPNSKNIWVDSELLFSMVHWRVAEEDSKKIRGMKKAKRVIDTNKMFA